MIRLLFQIFTGIPLLFLVGFVGKSSTAGFGYVLLADIFEDGAIGFNLLVRILSAPIYITFLSIVLYEFGFNGLVQGLWHISIWYALLNLLLLFFLGRLPLVNKYLYFFVHLSSIAISFWLYSVALSRGLDFILPDAGNFRSQIWFIVIIFFYSLLNQYEPNSSLGSNRRRNYIIDRYKYFSQKFGSCLSGLIAESELLRKLFFSIMITENFNRGYIFRLFERVCFPLGIIKTSGIMQVESKTLLSDEASIKLAAQKIESSFRKYKDSVVSGHTSYELLSKIIGDYNRGSEYFSLVYDIFLILEEQK